MAGNSCLMGGCRGVLAVIGNALSLWPVHLSQDFLIRRDCKGPGSPWLWLIRAPSGIGAGFSE